MARDYRLSAGRRFANTLMTTLIKLGVGGKSSYLLTTTGRKTGQPRTTPVTLVQDGADRWLVSPYGLVGWVYNVRAQPQVTLSRGRSRESLAAVEAEPQAAGPVLQRYLKVAPITAPYFDVKASDPVQQFVAEASRHPVFKLTERSSAGG